MKLARLATVLATAALSAALGAVALAATGHEERFAPSSADQRLAASVVFHRSDLKGSWSFALKTRPTSGGPDCAGFDPDFSRFTITGHADSTFSAGGQAVTSQVDVFRTQAEAVADFKLGTTAKGWACARSMFEDGLREGVKGATVTTTQWKVTHPRLDTFDVNAVFTVTTATVSVPLTFEFVALQTGRGQVALMLVSPAAKPIPEAAALARTLGARSRAL